MTTISSSLIQEGDFVVVKTETVLRIVQIRQERPLFLGKRKIQISSVINHPYGTFFEVKRNGSLEAAQTVADLNFTCVDDAEVKDNRSLIGSGTSQKLTTDDIEAFKAEGIPGEEIVKIIVENSSSFKDKSQYSQEKYLKKKQLKYMNYIQVLKTNTRFLIETYYQLHPQKICNLRIDTLSQMLTFCNVMSGNKYIVADSVLGLLTAAVLEKVGGEGIIIQMHMGPAPRSTYRQAVDALNYSESYLKSILYSIDFQKGVTALQSSDSTKEVQSTFLSNAESSIKQTDSISSAEANEIKKQEILQKRLEKQKEKEHIKKLLFQKDFDGLLVAIKHHPTDVLQLLDFLTYSRPFAVFSMYQQPLVDCYTILKSRGDIILLNISETWLRKYQVLPERTHPDYTMFCNSGFLLTGIKVEPK